MNLAASEVAAVVADGYDVVLTHGNGPQVGNIVDAFERADGSSTVPSLDVCVAHTQGAIGYAITSALDAQLSLRGIKRKVVTVITRVRVDLGDPAWQQPSKPIGGYLSNAEAVKRRRSGQHCVLVDERGWRRVVPSPQPLDILDVCSIRRLVDAGTIVVAAGGGGIPVVCDHTARMAWRQSSTKISPAVCSRPRSGRYVANRDRRRSRLSRLRAPRRTPTGSATSSELRRLAAQGEFAAGSMAPKVEAVARFVDSGGRQAVITAIRGIQSALRGCTGTRVTSS